MENKETKLTEKEALHIGGVSGSVVISKGRSQATKRVRCGDWLNDTEYCIVKDDGECLVVKKCYMEIPKKAKKIDVDRKLEFIGQIPIGAFDIDDEESNEDELVVYYR